MLVTQLYTAASPMGKKPLSTKGNAIYGKGPQKNLGGNLIKRKSTVGEGKQFSQCAGLNMRVCGMETR